MKLKKSFIVTLIIVVLMSVVAGCGVKEPQERLVDALENGKQLDLTKPFIASVQINLDKLNLDGQGLNPEEIEIVNQLNGSELSFEIIGDLEKEQFQINASGTMFTTPFETTVYATSNQVVIDTENLKQLITKIEDISGESSEIPLDQLKKYIVIDTTSDQEYQSTLNDMKTGLADYQQTQVISQQLATSMFKALDKKYFSNNDDYVMLSFNNESLKELIDQLIAKFEADPEGIVNSIYVSIEEFYPSIAQMAEMQGEPVPSKEEFMAELDQAKKEVLAQAADKENLQMVKNSIDQGYQMLSTFFKLNKYEIGYEIDKGNIVGSSVALDLQIQKSAFVPISLELILTAKSHFENAEKTIEIPELNEENSQDANELAF